MAPDAFKHLGPSRCFRVLVLGELCLQISHEGPTVKCITKLGHCVSIISSQNCHLLYNFPPKYNYFIFPAYARGPVMFSVNAHNCIFLHLNNMEAEEQLEMKCKK